MTCLGSTVDRQADDATIKKAYKKLAKKYHPDKNKDEGAQAKFADVSHGQSNSTLPSATALAGEAERLTWSVHIRLLSLRGSDGHRGPFTRSELP
jgi:hypothetical protein